MPWRTCCSCQKRTKAERTRLQRPQIKRTGLSRQGPDPLSFKASGRAGSPSWTIPLFAWRPVRAAGQDLCQTQHVFQLAAEHEIPLAKKLLRARLVKMREEDLRLSH